MNNGSGSNPYLASYRASPNYGQTQTAAQPTTPPPSSGSGGIGGFLFNSIIKPTAEAAGAVVPSIIHGGAALGDIAHNVITGDNSDAAKQQVLDEFRQTFAGKSLPSTVAAVKAGPVGQQLEQAAGNSATEGLNLAAPIAGAETTGVKGLALLGAKLGAAGGAANAAAQGDNGGDVINNAIGGGLVGGATGLAGGYAAKGASALLGKVAGKAVGPGSGEPAVTGGANVTGGDAVINGTAAPKQNMFDAAATKQAQTNYVNQANSEFGNGGAMTSKNGTPINAVLANMNDHGVNPTVSNMASYGQAGFAHNDLLDGIVGNSGKQVPVDTGQMIKDAFIGQSGLGSPSVSGSQANHIAQGLRDTLDGSLPVTSDGTNSTNVLNQTHHPSELLQAASDLYKAAPQSGAEAQVYANLRQALIDKAGNEGGVNKAISDYQLPSVADHLSGVSPNSDVQHILDMSHGNESLAQNTVDNMNSAKTIQNVQQAELPHIAANELATSHAKAIGATLPEVPTGSKGSFSTVTPTDGYMATQAIHNPVMAAALVARKAPGFIENQLAKHGTPDMSQVGPRTIPDTSGNGFDSGGAPAGAGPPTPPPPPPVVDDHSQTNVLQRMMGGVKTAHATGAMGAVTANVANSLGQGLSAPGQKPFTIDTSNLAGIDQAANAANNDAPTLDGSTIPGGTLQDLQQEIQQDPKNAAAYESIYADAQKQIAASAPTKLNASEAKNLTNIQNATDSLSQYVDQLNSISGRGVGIGATTSILGKLGLGGANGAQANALDTNKAELATQLAQAMNNGNKPNAALVKQVTDSLPSINDNAQVAADKVKILSNRLSSYLSNATNGSVTNRNSGNTSQLLSNLSGGN